MWLSWLQCSNNLSMISSRTICIQYWQAAQGVRFHIREDLLTKPTPWDADKSLIKKRETWCRPQCLLVNPFIFRWFDIPLLYIYILWTFYFRMIYAVCYSINILIWNINNFLFSFIVSYDIKYDWNEYILVNNIIKNKNCCQWYLFYHINVTK